MNWWVCGIVPSLVVIFGLVGNCGQLSADVLNHRRKLSAHVTMGSIVICAASFLAFVVLVFVSGPSIDPNPGVGFIDPTPFVPIIVIVCAALVSLFVSIAYRFGLEIGCVIAHGRR